MYLAQYSASSVDPSEFYLFCLLVCQIIFIISLLPYYIRFTFQLCYCPFFLDRIGAKTCFMSGFVVKLELCEFSWVCQSGRGVKRVKASIRGPAELVAPWGGAYISILVYLH